MNDDVMKGLRETMATVPFPSHLEPPGVDPDERLAVVLAVLATDQHLLSCVVWKDGRCEVSNKGREKMAAAKAIADFILAAEGTTDA